MLRRTRKRYSARTSSTLHSLNYLVSLNNFTQKLMKSLRGKAFLLIDVQSKKMRMKSLPAFNHRR